MATLSEITRVFARIGVLSFGGPAAQIALMHKELVEDRPWLSEEQFLRALSFCMLLPGPEAMQLATFAGWRLRGVLGGLIAGALFVLPGAAVILALALAYAAYGELPWVQALFLGVQATVVVIVLQAIGKVAKKALKRRGHWVLAGLAFAALFVFDLPFPLVIACAAIWGALNAPNTSTAKTTLPDLRPSLRVAGVFGVLWLLPLVLLWAFGATFLLTLGLFFAKLAVVTFGGAYAVLAYMTQEVVATHGWLTTAQMMDALGLAETTPGPLILVTQFVGHLAGADQGLFVIAGVLTLWVTFMPCFLWIFAGAPLIDWLDGQPRLSAALQAITAAVVGVILNLSVWFAAHVLFQSVSHIIAGPINMIWPHLTTLSLPALALTGLASALLLWRGLSLPLALLITALVGLLINLI